MDALVHRLESEIRQRAADIGRDEQTRAALIRKLDDIRLSITRQDALRLEVLIERLTGPQHVR